MENVTQGDFVQRLRALIIEAPGGDCTVVMRIDGTHSDVNLQVSYGVRQIAAWKVCISRGDTRRIDTWRLKLLLAVAICYIQEVDKEFPDDRINAILIDAIQSGTGSVVLTLQTGQLTNASHRV